MRLIWLSFAEFSSRRFRLANDAQEPPRALETPSPLPCREEDISYLRHTPREQNFNHLAYKDQAPRTTSDSALLPTLVIFSDLQLTSLAYGDTQSGIVCLELPETAFILSWFHEIMIP